MYLNDGQAVLVRALPEEEPKFFDESASIYEFPQAKAFPSGEVPAAIECTGCPSQGGSGA